MIIPYLMAEKFRMDEAGRPPIAITSASRL